VTPAPELLIASRSPCNVLLLPFSAISVVVAPIVILTVPVPTVVVVVSAKLAEATVPERANVLTVSKWLPTSAFDPALTPSAVSFAPTWSWQPGEPVRDSYCNTSVDAGLMPRVGGAFGIEVVWYRQSDLFETARATLTGVRADDQPYVAYPAR